jgi:hypothetical protein
MGSHNVLNNHITFMLSIYLLGLLDPKIKKIPYFKMSITTSPLTEHRIPEDLHFQQYHYEKPKSCEHQYVRHKGHKIYGFKSIWNFGNTISTTLNGYVEMKFLLQMCGDIFLNRYYITVHCNLSLAWTVNCISSTPHVMVIQSFYIQHEH